MVVIGTLLAAGVVLYWLFRWRGHDLLDNRWFLRFSVVAGPLAIVAVELGWIATEVGRQPWTVWQVLRTSDAASMSSGLWWSYFGVLVVYAGMTIGAWIVLRSMARRWRAGESRPAEPVRAATRGAGAVTLASVVAMAMFVGVVVYALFAGADFGSGFYDLTAGFDERGSELRTLVDTSIGPVWEANHVWLIYILVIWWTGFPKPSPRRPRRC